MMLVSTLAIMLATRVDPQRVSWKMNPVGDGTGTVLSSSKRCSVGGGGASEKSNRKASEQTNEKHKKQNSIGSKKNTKQQRQA